MRAHVSRTRSADRVERTSVRLKSFEAITTALDGAGVRYLVAGGLAVAAHGYLRFTKDVDLVVELVPDNIERAFAALRSLGYKPTVPITSGQFANAELRASWKLSATERFPLSQRRRTSDRDDLDDPLESREVGRIARVDGQAVGGCCGGNEQICEPRAARLSGRSCSGEQSAVHPGRFSLERQRVPCGSGPLEAVLAASALVLVVGRVWACGELGKSDGGYGGFVGQRCGIDHVVINHHRGIEKTFGRFSHRCVGRSRRRDPPGTEQRPHAGRDLRRRQ